MYFGCTAITISLFNTCRNGTYKALRKQSHLIILSSPCHTLCRSIIIALSRQLQVWELFWNSWNFKMCPEMSWNLLYVLIFCRCPENSENRTPWSEWLLYVSSSALDGTTDKFRNNICAYWLHVSNMVDTLTLWEKRSTSSWVMLLRQQALSPSHSNASPKWRFSVTKEWASFSERSISVYLASAPTVP